MKILRIIPILTLLLSLNYAASAQHYDRAVGLRGGLLTGVTYKQFVTDQAAVEGIMAWRWRGFEVTGLYEMHNPAFEVDGLMWYYGAGGHVGFYGNYSRHPWYDNSYRGGMTVGIDGIIGLEYTFTDLPINISLDWKPELNVLGYFGFWGDEGAVSVRYIF